MTNFALSESIYNNWSVYDNNFDLYATGNTLFKSSPDNKNKLKSAYFIYYINTLASGLIFSLIPKTCIIYISFSISWNN